MYESQPPFCARIRVAPEALPLLGEYVGERARSDLYQSRIPGVKLDLPFESFVADRTRLLGLGRAVEVLEPEALRRSQIDFAAQVMDSYGYM